MAAKGGDAGNQIIGDGAGGTGGNVGNNGIGGDGGAITIFTNAKLETNGDLDSGGGSVGVYSATSGNGGNAGTDAGAGGGAGQLGNNGQSGAGNKIKIRGLDAAIDFKGSLLANGGSVAGPYTGTGGKGGNGPDGGGPGTQQGGSNGTAGVGGSISVLTRNGSITAKLVSASGGLTSARKGTSGDGGDGGPHGGNGGAVGAGTQTAADRGAIDIESEHGDITLDGNVQATGSTGGDVNARSGNGGFGVMNGGNGGAVAAAGDGGPGGAITIKSGRTLTVNNRSKIVADGGDGGNQFGSGGIGGPSDGTAGNDGMVGPPGDGGAAGTITIEAKEKKPAEIETSKKAGTPGMIGNSQ
jgi:hypothetical protein